MKIDLHLHTKKVASGDPKTRYIDKNNFKKIIKDAKVGIAAITNHYDLDVEQYEEFKDNAYILLPGVELDVEINNRRVQANVIAPSEEVNVLKEILNTINNSKNPMLYNDFKKEFNRKKWIIYLDYKNSKSTSWKHHEMREVISEMNNTLVLADTNKAKTLMVLNSNNYNAFIGSDIQDWKNYPKKAKELINTYLNIDSYDRFWKILKYKETNIEDLFISIEKREFKDIKMPETNYKIDKIIFREGVNIIFGAKRTGKSEILKFVKNELSNKQTYYASSEKDNNIKKIQDDILDKSIFQEEKKEYLKTINEIIQYKEGKFTNFHDFFLWIKSNSKIKFHDNLGTKFIKPESNIEKSKKIEKIKTIAYSVKKAWEELRGLGYNFLNWETESKNILRELWIEWKNIFQEYWKKKINKKIKKAIDVLTRKHNGIVPKPSNIGLLNRFHSKKIFLNNINKLEYYKHFKCNMVSFEIPGRKNIKAVQELFFIDIFKLSNMDKFSGKTILRNIKKYISKLNYKSDFNHLSKLFNDFNMKNTFQIEEVKIQDENGKSDFSNGEKAHLVLSNALNKDKEYYLLDEPAVFLSKESITEFLLPKIATLARSRKKIIIVTHNSSLGINTIPISYVYRKYKNKIDECATYIGSIWENTFTNISDESDKMVFTTEIIGSFEGSEKHFEFRKEIYENKI